MKTPPYIKKAQKDFRERKRKLGYRYFFVLVSPEHFKQLKDYYKSIKGEK